MPEGYSVQGPAAFLWHPSSRMRREHSGDANVSGFMPVVGLGCRLGTDRLAGPGAGRRPTAGDDAQGGYGWRRSPPW